MYGSNCQTIDNEQEDKIEDENVKVDKWRDQRRQNKNEYIRDSVGMTSIVDKIRENRL